MLPKVIMQKKVSVAELPGNYKDSLASQSQYSSEFEDDLPRKNSLPKMYNLSSEQGLGSSISTPVLKVAGFQNHALARKRLDEINKSGSKLSR